MADVEFGTGGAAPDAGRRKLLKIAAAAGGAIAATAILPGTWSKPIAQIGALPAHAQTSDAPITLTNALFLGATDQSLPDAALGQARLVSQAGLNIMVQCNWEDPLGRLNSNTSLQTLVMNGGCPTDATFAAGYASGIYPYWDIRTNPDGMTGTMIFNVITPCLNGNYLEWWVTADGQSSDSPSNPYVYFTNPAPV